MRRLFESVVLLIVAVLFILFGSFAIRNNAVLWGGAFVLLGLIALAGLVLHLWRGDRVGVRIIGNDLVIQHYFSTSNVPLGTIRKVYRSVDATVIETLSGKLVFDDCYFDDPQTRDALLQSLKEHMDHGG